MRVVAKTTGTAARVILPDGTEYDLRGGRRPSLLEYATVARLAAHVKADALVVECMALRPEFQRVSEHRLLRSTIGVLTGAAADHEDVMGGSLEQIRETLAETVPAHGLLVTPGPDVPRVWTERARALGTRVCAVLPDPAPPLPASYIEWPENVALAAAVCEAVGVERATALRAMQAAGPDPGALRVWRWCRPDGRAVWFIGAFGANDPASTQRAVGSVRGGFDLRGLPLVGILNTRGDRGERTLQWCQTLSQGGFPVVRVLITGPHAAAATRRLVRAGWPAAHVHAIHGASPAAITQAAQDAHGGRDVVVVGVGNMRGAGAALMAHWISLCEGDGAWLRP